MAARKAKVSRVRSAPRYGGEFTSELFTYPGKGGWTFTTVPEQFAPPVTEGW